jgi:hypothetical protein
MGSRVFAGLGGIRGAAESNPRDVTRLTGEPLVRLGFLDYFPAEQVLSYQGYDFSLRKTNEIRSLFQ